MNVKQHYPIQDQSPEENGSGGHTGWELALLIFQSFNQSINQSSSQPVNFRNQCWTREAEADVQEPMGLQGSDRCVLGGILVLLHWWSEMASGLFFKLRTVYTEGGSLRGSEKQRQNPCLLSDRQLWASRG